VQNIGRAARNPESEVVLYADKMTASMVKSLWETYRRRGIQEQHNIEHDITPTQAISNVKDLGIVRTDEELQKHQDFQLVRKGKAKKLKRMTKKEKALIAENLREELDKAITEWRFEDAAVIRDHLEELHA
jgi:excinuclease ABC subunit B